MAVEVGQTWSRKHKKYKVVKVDTSGQFTYIEVNGIDNYCNKVFGVTAFLGEFNLIKEVENGSS